MNASDSFPHWKDWRIDTLEILTFLHSWSDLAVITHMWTVNLSTIVLHNFLLESTWLLAHPNGVLQIHWTTRHMDKMNASRVTLSFYIFHSCHLSKSCVERAGSTKFLRDLSCHLDLSAGVEKSATCLSKCISDEPHIWSLYANTDRISDNKSSSNWESGRTIARVNLQSSCCFFCRRRWVIWTFTCSLGKCPGELVNPLTTWKFGHVCTETQFLPCRMRDQ